MQLPAFSPANTRILFPMSFRKSKHKKTFGMDNKSVSSSNNISMLSALFCVVPKVFLLSKNKVLFIFAYDGVSATKS